MFLNDFFEQSLNLWGVQVNDSNVVCDRKKLPTLTYNRKLDSYVLHFQGPNGFGMQSFVFDRYDFCSAYYDTQGNHHKCKDERVSFGDYFLGQNWENSLKSGQVILLFFCFNLSPSSLDRAKFLHSNLVLMPKKKHILSLQNIPDLLSLNDFMTNH